MYTHLYIIYLCAFTLQYFVRNLKSWNKRINFSMYVALENKETPKRRDPRADIADLLAVPSI